VAYREVTPIGGPEAFEATGRDAELSQAAIVLSAGAAVGGRAERIERPASLGLPVDLRRIGREETPRLGETVAAFDLDLRSHVDNLGLRLPEATSAGLTRRLVDRPDAVTAAALVEANLHSESRLVRTAAAVAALDTTGPRDDVLDRLVDGAQSPDTLTHEIGRIGVARVAPQHRVLRRVVRPSGAETPEGTLAGERAGAAAVLTHGTFAANTRWWQPGGSLYRYLDALTPPLHVHDPSFRWSGQYSDGARQLAAQQLVEWTAGFGLQMPDLFAHSHGGTVGNLATHRGLQIDRLVLMSWPVHGEWFPDFSKVRIVVDIRVRFDLVILADRGGQRFRPPAAFRGKVVSHVNGWFNHGDTNDPAYWERYGLPEAIRL
jgi:hypothetical protein